MKTFIILLLSTDPIKIGYITLDDLQQMNSICRKITTLLLENFPDTDPIMGIPATILYNMVDENVASVICGTKCLLGLPDDLIVKYSNIDCLYIYYICTDSRYRGRGYAKNLLELMIDIQVKKRIKNIFIDVPVENTVAYNIYLKFGFVKISSMVDRGINYDILSLNLPLKHASLSHPQI